VINFRRMAANKRTVLSLDNDVDHGVKQHIDESLTAPTGKVRESHVPWKVVTLEIRNSYIQIKKNIKTTHLASKKSVGSNEFHVIAMVIITGE